jgi:dienelactone hydrolase
MNLSPSVYHQSLALKTKPSLSYIRGDVRKWRNTVRRKLRQLLGDMSGERCALNARQIWKRPHSLGTIEKIVFTSEPYADVVAYVCLPKLAKPPFTFMICLQGHTTGMHQSIAVEQGDEVTALRVDGDRDFALGCMRQGIAALCIEQRAFGERLEKVQKKASPLGCLDATLQAQMLGKTLIGERVYDVDRGIDYLRSRGDADMKSIGVMGNSSGGAISMYAAALLPRLAFAMPSCYFCTFRDSVMAMNHCEENYIPGLMKYLEMADIMGAFAPKPVVIVAGREDSMFPIGATRRAFSKLKRIYKAHGAADRCHLVIGEGGHRFYANEAWPVALKEIKRVRGGL